ncbi:MAG: hypothetical protein ACRYE9_02975 [Janthinobacterium lividum]
MNKTLLLKLPQGTVVVIDNPAFHKGSTMQEQIKQQVTFLSISLFIALILIQSSINGHIAKYLRRKHSCDIDSLFRHFCT